MVDIGCLTYYWNGGSLLADATTKQLVVGGGVGNPIHPQTPSFDKEGEEHDKIGGVKKTDTKYDLADTGKGGDGDIGVGNYRVADKKPGDGSVWRVYADCVVIYYFGCDSRLWNEDYWS